MAVDSVANPYEPEPQKPDYPCLRKVMSNEDVVLFSGPRTGVVVVAGYWPVGYSCSTWLDDCFEPFHGQVVLTSA